MRFNRAISKIKVLSFDLDDTLYNNHPIIRAALQAQADYLLQIPKWPHQDAAFWSRCRNQAVQQTPELAHDVTAWRQQALYIGLLACGFNHTQATKHAQQAYAAFAQARSQITVCPSVLTLLTDLKQRYTLIAITNGNVEVDEFNLAGVFSLVLQAGKDGRAKPYPDLFDNAARQLNVKHSNILHIGDNLDTDVQGANNAKCHSVWLNNQDCQYQYQGLADIEISNIKQLNIL
ncbi:5-amino-6-(5-phospho-D-ribitylamino)uracil phosphatase YigB [Pseudoalteromonas holothuriae]|uniref:5-amino-6-(5-phospho-D-ribitylamino)uracil phosphatase YigB n=1 Tax=Pseudoalteromonas holothuriae TaxID=2963714 RepID=A0A9W4VVD4_9GAMM|nr:MULTISPECIES: HAD-IA family hydrolase [unclassified Pseudoalteromonas]CAH9065521.1 5-amino-6-(5-phospho-D-ribitylamino)uracil phosphatase YigB [Pseudoalteromonas sp. CIP111854]CAH9067208.1 5-amino-6-(5-phospho-D-ribitylamino)uracil phosphatase YigB [Pseudoalteromonas sp. CIP111951]